jgi:hypothetical protein
MGVYPNAAHPVRLLPEEFAGIDLPGGMVANQVEVRQAGNTNFNE